MKILYCPLVAVILDINSVCDVILAVGGSGPFIKLKCSWFSIRSWGRFGSRTDGTASSHTNDWTSPFHKKLRQHCYRKRWWGTSCWPDCSPLYIWGRLFPVHCSSGSSPHTCGTSYSYSLILLRSNIQDYTPAHTSTPVAGSRQYNEYIPLHPDLYTSDTMSDRSYMSSLQDEKMSHWCIQVHKSSQPDYILQCTLCICLRLSNSFYICHDTSHTAAGSPQSSNSGGSCGRSWSWACSCKDLFDRTRSRSLFDRGTSHSFYGTAYSDETRHHRSIPVDSGSHMSCHFWNVPGWSGHSWGSVRREVRHSPGLHSHCDKALH